MDSEKQTKTKSFRLFGRVIPTNRVIFFILAIFIQLSVIWPLYAVFSAAEPFILGFPLSFAWLISILLFTFATMIFLYITDNRRIEQQASSSDELEEEA